MANKTNLSSWGSLKSYLMANIDKEKDWDNIDLKDYVALSDAYAQGKITGDKLAEGKTLLQNYLADAQAANTYSAAKAQAENTARQENAYSNYLHTRLGSYLRELQGNAGQKGYIGTVQGQAVALKNAQENAFQQTQEGKRTSLSDYLEQYQKALTDNSATAIDQISTLQASRDQKKDTDLQNYIAQVDKFIQGDPLLGIDGVMKDGVIPAGKVAKLNDYIASLPDGPAKTELEKYIELTYKDKMQSTQTVTLDDGRTVEQIVDATDVQTAQAQAQKDYEFALTNISNTNDMVAKKAEIEKALNDGKISQDAYNALKTTITEKEKELYKTSKSSGGLSIGNTATLKFNTKDGYFTGNNITVTFAGAGKRITTPSAASDFSEGQVFLYNGAVYVKKGENSLRVIDYEGNGAYEKLQKYLKGTYYDIAG